MDPHKVVEEMKDLGASEDAIEARLDNLGVGSSKQDELLEGYATKDSHDKAGPYSFLLDYIPYWILGILLVSAGALYFIRPDFLIAGTIYVGSIAVIVFPMTWVLRYMVSMYSNGYGETYHGIKDYILSVFIAFFIWQIGFLNVLIVPLFSGIPILIILIVFYDLTPTEAFMTTVFMVMALLASMLALTYGLTMLNDMVATQV